MPYRLQREDKVIEVEKFAAFNTGLVDRRYEPIYALFKKSYSRRKKWELDTFCIAGEKVGEKGAGKILVREFPSLPKQASYLERIDDVLYDPSAGEPILDFRHIIIDNISRLPSAFLEENAPKNFELKDTTKMSYYERTNYFKLFGQAVKQDDSAFRRIKNRLDDALKLALKRVQWNYKTAIPMYFPTFNTMSLLLPLALVNDEEVDIALVIEKTKSGSYQGHTILTLDWAYKSARLICRPDSDWLIARNITQNDADDI